MSVYSVYEPTDHQGSKAQRADKLLFVRDSLSRPTLVFGPFWLLVKQQWISLLAYAVLAALFVGLGVIAGLPSAVWGYIYLGLNLIFALEEPLMRGMVLEATGWRFVGVSDGPTQEEAEYRFIASWLASDETESVQTPLARPQAITVQTSPKDKIASAYRENRPPRILN